MKFFSNDLIDITLKTSKGIEKVKKYYLVLKVAVCDIKNFFLLVIFSNFFLITSISQILICELLSLI